MQEVGSAILLLVYKQGNTSSDNINYLCKAEQWINVREKKKIKVSWISSQYTCLVSPSDGTTSSKINKTLINNSRSLWFPWSLWTNNTIYYFQYMFVNHKLDYNASCIVEFNYSLTLHCLILMYECLISGPGMSVPKLWALLRIWSQKNSELCHVVMYQLGQLF